MSDAYAGKDSRRSDAPCGCFRTELVRLTKANEIVLSGSPIEYFVHADYQTGAWREGGGCTLKFGIEAIYNHTDAAWVDPSVSVSAVSEDGYTITLSGGNCGAGDLVEVYYYAKPVGTSDHETGAQVGDVRAPETLDALVQKINDCPPLDWENNSMVFDQELCFSNVDPGVAKTTVAKYAAVQVGTWQTTHTPFYVTGVILSWTVDADDIATGLTLTEDHLYITVDGGTERDLWMAYLQHTMIPATGNQYIFVNLGLVECESDFEVETDFHAGYGASTFNTRVCGWHL